MKVVCFDLDDTLCKEIDYLKSAYREIASYAAQQFTGTCVSEQVLEDQAYKVMLTAYQKGRNAFDALNAYLGLNLTIDELLYLYRNHKPIMSLSDDVSGTLSALKINGCHLGLITDGRSVQQRNKIGALGLTRWFDAEDIIISEEFGSEKPALDNYEYFMKRYPVASFTYIGDNLKKDFVGANALGWDTVCLLNDGTNIHQQEFSNYSDEYQPKYIISSLVDIIKLVAD